MLGHIAEKTVQTGQGEEKYRQFRLAELLSDPLHHLRVEAAVETALNVDHSLYTPLSVEAMETVRTEAEALLAGSVVSQKRAGDAMIPFGRHEAVKLKKLMIDAGVERPLRGSMPVLRQGDTILWAVTLRPSAFCHISGGERGLMVTFKEREYAKDQELKENNQGDFDHG